MSTTAGPPGSPADAVAPSGAVLVTGALGFVGRHLLAHLYAAGDGPIVALMRGHEPPPTHLPASIELVAADLNDRAAVRRLLAQARPTCIYHLAAQSSVAVSRQDPLATLLNNISGQVNLCETLIELGLQPRLLVVGSSEEYGRVRADELPIPETAELRPLNAYAVSKAAQDLLGYQYFQSHGLPIVRVRPSAHTGPGQEPHFVTPAFARQIALIEAGLQPAVLSVGNLEARRDFTDVRDVVRGYRAALRDGEPGEVYNLGSGRAVSIRELLALLLRQSTLSITVEVDPGKLRPSESPLQLADCRKLRARTGWRPRIPLEQTLADMLAEWRAQVARVGAAC